MKIWFDTEFMEDGKTIELLSIGAEREDSATFYAECKEADHSKASEWVKANVLPKLTGGAARMPRYLIAESFKKFCGERPELWAYYADYDWVALCQLYGTMMDLPKGWPMFCRDVKQLCVSVGNPKLPPQTGEHHALADAKWTRAAWDFLQTARAEVESLEGELWNEARSLGADIIERLDGVCSSDYVAGEVYEAMRKCMNKDRK